MAINNMFTGRGIHKVVRLLIIVALLEGGPV